MKGDFQPLYQRLGYRFGDEGYLTASLTHRSVGSVNNERLEFLGDALLNFVVGDALFRASPRASEGDLTRLRASLVRESTLADLARELQLGDLLHLGSGELRSGGYRRQSILADTFEALIGAIYLDGGFDAVSTVILHLYASRLKELPDPESLKDPKTLLQELLQGRGMPLPRYEVVELTGEAHNQVFRVRCSLESTEFVSEGSGSSRRRAEQHAASLLFERLRQDLG